ncbi:MAG: DNA-binding CsgD family transcriptional regulator [Cyclobacteriaceae bacterium]|jgi:DNA-binding CsgD family transcriptional regulator
MFRTFLKAIYIFINLIFGFSVSAQQLNLPKVPIRVHFEPGEYGGGIQNWDFAQDTSGILYVANNDGLIIFDGEDWKSHIVPSATKIRAVFADINGDIYVGGQGQIGVFKESQHGLKFHQLLNELPNSERDISETWKILKFNNEIYFSTLDKLLVIKDKKLQKVELPGQPLRLHNVDNKLFIQIKDQGILDISSSEYSILPGTDQIKTELTGAAQLRGNLVFFGIDGSVYEVSREETIKLDNRQLNGNIINVVIQLKNRGVAIGTQNMGLLIFDEAFNFVKKYTKGQGISNRTVIAILEDDFSNLWIGLHTGIDYLELSSPLSLVTEQLSFEGTGYLASVWNNKTYLGTNNGLFAQKADRFELVPGSEGQVYNLSVINGSLIMNHHKGAFVVEPSGLKQISNIGSWKITKTPIPGKYIAGSYDGIRFFERKNGELRPTGEIQGLDESSRVFEFENDSTIWMTHGYKGAYRIIMDKSLNKTISINHYGAEDGFPSNTLINVYEIMGSLVFTGETGFYNYDPIQDRFFPNKFLDDLFGKEHVSKITVTEEGDIFFIQNRKAGFLRQESLGKYRKETNIFNRIDKYISDDLESIVVLDKQNVLIGGKEGFIHFDPSAQVQIKELFDVVIRKASVISMDSVTHFTAKAFHDTKIKHGESLALEFASPYFYGFEDLKYSYRILPVHEKWTEWSSQHNREFSFLPAGNYQFEVKARNVFGGESSITKLNFSVLKPWYSSQLAILIYALTVLMGFIGFSLKQRSKYYHEKDEINRSKEEAINEKEQIITEIEQKSKNELNVLRNEKLKIEINHKNSQLTSVTTHLLQKNVLIQDIKKKIEYTIDNGLTKNDLRKVVQHIEKDISNDDSWNQFAFHFDQVHGDFLKKIKTGYPSLTPQETKLAAYLRMNLTSKDIAQLLNISVRGVEISRYRLRKRLELERETNLVSFLMDI